MNTSLKHLALCFAVLATLSGCAQFQEHQSKRWSKKIAQQAFEEDPCAQKNGPTARDFERGWRQAYFDVARGGDGEAPVMPPQAYWAVKYQNAEGAQQIAAWYEGYLLGASAAHRDGVGRYNVIPTSPLNNCCGSGGCLGCANGSCSSNCSSCDLPAMQPHPLQFQQSPAVPGPVAPIVEYTMPPLTANFPLLQSLPPVEPEAIQVAETRPLNPSPTGTRYDGQVQTVGFAQPLDWQAK